MTKEWVNWASLACALTVVATGAFLMLAGLGLIGAFPGGAVLGIGWLFVGLIVVVGGLGAVLAVLMTWHKPDQDVAAAPGQA